MRTLKRTVGAMLGGAVLVTPVVAEAHAAASPTTNKAASSNVASVTAATKRPPLAFHDYFNGSKLSPAWSTCYQNGACTNPTRHENEWYQRENVSVSNSKLHLKAKRGAVTRNGVTYDYTSGMVTTADSYAVRSGNVVVRAKSVRGRPLWPAIWLYPLDNKNYQSNELDIAESYGDPDMVEQVMQIPGHGVVAKLLHLPNTEKTFHNYEVSWSSTKVTFSIDQKVTGVFNRKRPDKPVYLIMNLAVGSDFLGKPTKATPDTADLQIESVSIYSNAKNEAPHPRSS